MRLGSYKAHFITKSAYVSNPNKTYHDPPLLYNVDEDPSERFDIAAQNPAVVAEIRKAVEGIGKNKMDPDLLIERDKKYLTSIDNTFAQECN